MFKAKVAVIVMYLIIYAGSCEAILPLLVGAAAGVFFAPAAVTTVGFGAAGIGAGTIAAGMMSTLGGAATSAGSVVAICQSIGATGTVLGSGIATATAAGVGAAVGYAASSDD